MACFHPRRCWHNVRLGGRAVFQFPIGEDPLDYVEGVARCRNCIGCRADKARDVSLRAGHEAQTVGRASFLTLTYDRENLPWDSRPLSKEGQRLAIERPGLVLPWGGSLRRRDLVLFLKRLRKELAKEGAKVRAYQVGEYGGRTFRPHYHLCLFGHDFREDRRAYVAQSKSGHPMFTSARLDGLWGLGKCWINEMGREVAQYAAKYALKSLGAKVELRQAGGHLVEVEPPFDSLPHGKALGLPWLERYWSDVFPRGLVVLKGGIELPAPLAYMKVCKERDPDLFESIAMSRGTDGLRRFEHFMPERLKSREVVAFARADQGKRDAL